MSVFMVQISALKNPENSLIAKVMFRKLRADGKPALVGEIKLTVAVL